MREIGEPNAIKQRRDPFRTIAPRHTRLPSAKPRLAAALRRSITGRWNTMARRVGAQSMRPPQVIRPELGAASPMQSRSRLVLPAPFGPTISVGAPGAIVRLARSISRVPPASSETSSSTSGRSLVGARIVENFAMPHAVQRYVDLYESLGSSPR